MERKVAQTMRPLGVEAESIHACAPVTPGDRHPPINQRYPPEAFYHTGHGGRVLDVTQPPFNARGDGVTDDTQALSAALQFVREHYEIFRQHGCTYCGQQSDQNWIVYLPDGEYLVRDTVSQGWPALAMNIRNGWSQVEYLRVNSPAHEEELYQATAPDPLLHGNPETPAGDDNGGCYMRGQYNSAMVYAENNWAIRVIGQSRDHSVIRLQDAAAGFAEGAAKAVLALYLLQRGSNVNIGNIVENITIDTGRDNPGAVGLQWNSSNWGGVRNVAIRAGDGQGRAGLLTDANNATGYHHDLLIEGFDVGIEVGAGRETMVTLEYATLSGQRDTAIRLGDARVGGGGDSMSARGLLIRNAPLAARAGRAGQLMLLESDVYADTEAQTAFVVASDGFLLARDIRLSGYRSAVARDGQPVVRGNYLQEYVSTEPVRLRSAASPATLRLPIKDSPLLLPEPELSQWAAVDAYGAVGDGIADDTAAIQRAMEAGKPVVYFPKANYVINGTVNIPASVRVITGLFGCVHRAHASVPDGPGLFRVAAPSGEPLHICQLASAGGVLLDHEAERTVVLDDIFIFFNHTRAYTREAGVLPSAVAQNTTLWRLYRNTRPDGATKEVFVNDSSNFVGHDADGSPALENVHAWARMLNNEHLPGACYAFRRADAWIFGFKSENGNTLLCAEDHARLEVLGGSFLNWSAHMGPAILSRNSLVSAIYFLWHWGMTTETIWRHEDPDAVTTVPSTRFNKLDNVDGAVIAICHAAEGCKMIGGQTATFQDAMPGRDCLAD
ncbi:MAG TPA: glycosyl hydrolase family 28-related protein [Armatimonadota bacterium]|jgi:hypothetical protein